MSANLEIDQTARFCPMMSARSVTRDTEPPNADFVRLADGQASDQLLPGGRPRASLLSREFGEVVRCEGDRACGEVLL
jgi:hypothetical protein